MTPQFVAEALDHVQDEIREGGLKGTLVKGIFLRCYGRGILAAAEIDGEQVIFTWGPVTSKEVTEFLGMVEQQLVRPKKVIQPAVIQPAAVQPESEELTDKWVEWAIATAHEGLAVVKYTDGTEWTGYKPWAIRQYLRRKMARVNRQEFLLNGKKFFVGM
jgi:hypothetical protein